jgi:uncharacterized protein (UPF0335 family)
VARPKRKSAPAEAHNEEAEEVRQEAREASSNVVHLKDSAERTAERYQRIVELVEQACALRVEGKALNERRKAIFDDAEAIGLDRKAFRAHIARTLMEADKREAWEATMRECARAHGWDDGSQTELFREDSLPGVDRPFLAGDDETPEAGVDAGVAAAIEQGWLTEDEIAANRALDEDDEAEAEEVEQDDENDDLDEALLARAGVPVVSEDDA